VRVSAFGRLYGVRRLCVFNVHTAGARAFPRKLTHVWMGAISGDGLSNLAIRPKGQAPPSGNIPHTFCSVALSTDNKYPPYHPVRFGYTGASPTMRRMSTSSSLLLQITVLHIRFTRITLIPLLLFEIMDLCGASLSHLCVRVRVHVCSITYTLQSAVEP
jgi:hypothetical protein